MQTPLFLVVERLRGTERTADRYRDSGQQCIPLQSERAVTEPVSSTKDRERASALRSLSRRERQVAAHICRGETNKLIARKLGISEGTVKQHANAIFAKLGVRSRYELVGSRSDICEQVTATAAKN